jgi:hypothetical protein
LKYKEERKSGLVDYRGTPVIAASQEVEDLAFKTSQGKISKTLSQKQNTNKRAESVAQVVELWPRTQ